MTAPFSPGDTVVRVPTPDKVKKYLDPHGRLFNPPIGSVWTVLDCRPGRVANPRTGVVRPSEYWCVYLVGIVHPPWPYAPDGRVGYNHQCFRLAVHTDISELRGLLEPGPWTKELLGEGGRRTARVG